MEHQHQVQLTGANLTASWLHRAAVMEDGTVSERATAEGNQSRLVSAATMICQPAPIIPMVDYSTARRDRTGMDCLARPGQQSQWSR